MRKILFQESNFYGASELIFNDIKPPICFRATWMHGLGPVLINNYDKYIVIHYNEMHIPIHLVNNNDTVKELSEQNVDSIAVGLPFIYSKSFLEKTPISNKFKRIYFPVHSIAHTYFSNPEKWRQMISKYNCDAICLTGLDYKEVQESKVDFGGTEIILGAVPSDPSSLDRMAKIFLRSKEMITDFIGTHLAYAGASGTKIRVIDETKDNYWNGTGDELRGSVPKKYFPKFQKANEDSRKIYQSFMSSVWLKGNDREIKEYSEYLLGVEFQKPINEMKNYLKPVNLTQTLKIISLLLINKISRKIGK